MTWTPGPLFSGFDCHYRDSGVSSDNVSQAQMILLLPGAWALGEGVEIEMPSPVRTSAGSSCLLHHQSGEQQGRPSGCHGGPATTHTSCQHHTHTRQEHQHQHQHQHQHSQQLCHMALPCSHDKRRRRSCHTGAADVCHAGAAGTSHAAPPPAATRRHSCHIFDAPPASILGCSPFQQPPAGVSPSSHVGSSSASSSAAAAEEPLSAGLMRLASSFTHSVTGYLTDLVAWTTSEHPPPTPPPLMVMVMSPAAPRQHHDTGGGAAAAAAAAAGGPFGAAADAASAAASCGGSGGVVAMAGGDGAQQQKQQQQQQQQRYQRPRGYAPTGGGSGAAAASGPLYHTTSPMLLPVPSGLAEAAHSLSGDFADVAPAGLRQPSSGGEARDVAAGACGGAAACNCPRAGGGSGSGLGPRSRPGAASAGSRSVGGAGSGAGAGVGMGPAASGVANEMCCKKDA